MRRYVLVVALFLLAMMAASYYAQASVATITVDGVQYEASKYSGPTVHFETPDVQPVAAFTDRHVWSGNGSEHLPCEGGIHWIDNQNILTVSHCLEGGTTTTSTSTTSTTKPTTSTTTSSTTTTTEATTTTTDPTTTTTSSTTTVPSTTTTSTLPGSATSTTSSTTTQAPATTAPPTTVTTTIVVTTTVPSPTPTLPNTGAPLGVLFAAGFGLVLLGSLAIRATTDRRN